VVRRGEGPSFTGGKRPDFTKKGKKGRKCFGDRRGKQRSVYSSKKKKKAPAGREETREEYDDIDH